MRTVTVTCLRGDAVFLPRSDLFFEDRSVLRMTKGVDATASRKSSICARASSTFFPLKIAVNSSPP